MHNVIVISPAVKRERWEVGFIGWHLHRLCWMKKCKCLDWKDKGRGWVGRDFPSTCVRNRIPDTARLEDAIHLVRPWVILKQHTEKVWPCVPNYNENFCRLWEPGGKKRKGPRKLTLMVKELSQLRREGFKFPRQTRLKPAQTFISPLCFHVNSLLYTVCSSTSSKTSLLSHQLASSYKRQEENNTQKACHRRKNENLKTIRFRMLSS